MYGTATNVADIYDMIEQQAAGTQKPVCIGESTAYGDYLKKSLPDLQVYETSNNNAGFLQGLRDGHCESMYVKLLLFLLLQNILEVDANTSSLIPLSFSNSINAF